MANKRSKAKGLGRGLSALMADVSVDTVAGSAVSSSDLSAPIEKVFANPDQPRRTFSKTDLDDLAESIREKGIIQPLIVRSRDGGSYEIVAGERRWRAAQMAGLHEVPVIVREFDDTEVLEVAIIENIQRADLNAVEEAAGYRQLMEKFGHTQEKLSKALGKSRSHIANQMRLLQLPDSVIELLRQEKLAAGHARALITSDDAAAIAKLVVKNGLSVRETERLVKRGLKPKIKGAAAISQPKDADTKALETDLAATLGMKVVMNHKPGQESGSLQVSYKSLDELDELCRLLSAQK